MYFSIEKRPAMVEENNARPEDEKMSFGDFGKKLGAAWKELSEEEKAPYAEKAAADKVRYAEAMKAYVPVFDHESSDSESSVSSESDSSMDEE